MAWRRSASLISIDCGICCLRRSKDSALRVPWHQFAVAWHTIWIKRHQVKSFIDFSAGNRRTFWQHTWKSVRMAAGILACWAFHWVDIHFTTSLNNSHLVWEGFSSLRGLTWQKFLQSWSSATRFAPAPVSRNRSESCLCPHKKTTTQEHEQWHKAFSHSRCLLTCLIKMQISFLFRILVRFSK